MNNLDVWSLLPEKATALRTLSDEIYPLLRDAELAKFVANNLLDEYFGGDEPDGSKKCAERLMCGYGRAEAQMQILMDYIHSLETSLGKLEQIASGSEDQDQKASEDLLLELLTDAAKTGKVSSKTLGQLLRLLTGTEQSGSHCQTKTCAKGV